MKPLLVIAHVDEPDIVLLDEAAAPHDVSCVPSVVRRCPTRTSAVR